MRSFLSRLASVAVTPLICALTSAQNVLQINEVQFDDQWIEVANFGTQPIDLSHWSIYQATHTANVPQAYWWPIPAGTVLPAGRFLRVRWLHPVQAGNPDPLLIDTGETSYHFLFFLRGERLARQDGALALVATQDANLVNDASYYRDFVAWSGHNTPFLRENLAVGNGRWRAGARTLRAEIGQSLALDARDLEEPTPATAFFRDTSPTPSAPNQGRQSTATLGTGCVLGLGGPSQLRFVSIPVHGNADFRVVIDNLGDSRTALALWFGLPDWSGTPWLGPCTTYFDAARVTTAVPLLVTADTLFYRPDVESFVIPAIALQAVALRPNGAIVLTNGGVCQN